MRRAHDPDCWGPLAPEQLLRQLGREHHRSESYAARWGRKGTVAYLTAWQRLQTAHAAGLPLRIERLPINARHAARRVLLDEVWH